MKSIRNLLGMRRRAWKCEGVACARRPAGILGCWFGLGLAALMGGRGSGGSPIQRYAIHSAKEKIITKGNYD
jgi:hypothetical protein